MRLDTLVLGRIFYVAGWNKMKKWYDEEYEFEIEVTGFLRGNKTERYCRNGEETGDKYKCTYGCQVNSTAAEYVPKQ